MADGNPALRAMGWGRAREKCRGELRTAKEIAAYKKWCNDNRDELHTMTSTWRAVGDKRIPAKVT